MDTLEKRTFDARLFDVNCTDLLDDDETISSVSTIVADQGSLTFGTATVNSALVTYPDGTTAAIEVSGASDSPSTLLLAAWLRHQLQVPVKYGLLSRSNGSSGIHGVILTRESGDIELVRDVPNVSRLSQPNQPTHDLSLPRRNLRDCLAEELRRLDPDDLYGEVISQGLSELLESKDAGVRDAV